MLNTMQQNGWFMGGLDRYYTATFAEADAMFGDGEAAMKIEGTWCIAERREHTSARTPATTTTGTGCRCPSATGDAIFDLGIGRRYSINAHSRASGRRPRSSSTTTSRRRRRPSCWSKCGLAPAPVDLDRTGLTGVDPRAAHSRGAERCVRRQQLRLHDLDLLAPKTETYLIEEIEKVWAGDMTVEEYLQGIRTQLRRRARGRRDSADSGSAKHAAAGGTTRRSAAPHRSKAEIMRVHARHDRSPRSLPSCRLGTRGKRRRVLPAQGRAMALRAANSAHQRAVVAGPALAAFYYSMTDWNGIGAAKLSGWTIPHASLR